MYNVGIYNNRYSIGVKVNIFLSKIELRLDNYNMNTDLIVEHTSVFSVCHVILYY